MKRSSYKTNVSNDATCMVCHNDMDDRTGVRSNTWFKGIIGARAVLCSSECRDSFDEDNRVVMEAMEDADA